MFCLLALRAKKNYKYNILHSFKELKKDITLFSKLLIYSVVKTHNFVVL
jgi:hypothetical protein